MFSSTFSLKVATLATAVVLVFAGDSPAQHGGHGGGGHGGGFGGFAGHGGGGGFRGGGYRGFGRGGFGYGGFGYGGWGWGGLGPGYGLYDWGYPGWGYGGYYDGGYYAPNYGVLPYNYSNDYAPYTATVTPLSGDLSFYPPDSSYGQLNNNTASIDVKVPVNAKLWFDGQKTSQTGSERLFVTPALEPGKTFSYEVRASWLSSDGKQETRTRTVEVHANQSTMVNFMDTQNPAD
jgi:uncharacterized protein (TIGR03000 family)